MKEPQDLRLFQYSDRETYINLNMISTIWWNPEYKRYTVDFGHEAMAIRIESHYADKFREVIRQHLVKYD